MPAPGIAGGAPELENAEQARQEGRRLQARRMPDCFFAISDTAAMMMPHNARLTTKYGMGIRIPRAASPRRHGPGRGRHCRRDW